MKDVEIIDSKIQGPTVAIMGGIHGNEPCGLGVIDFVKKNINIKKGKIFLIKGNPKAIQKNVRQIEVNLNRVFKDDDELSDKIKKTYEFKRSRELMKIFDQSDLLIDIHSSSIENTIPFTIGDIKNNHIIDKLPIVFSCSDFNKIDSGSTDFYMNKNNKIGICIECGHHTDQQSVILGIDCVKIILADLKMIESKNSKNSAKKHTDLRAVFMYKTKTDDFKISKTFLNFEKIKKGQQIAIDGNTPVIAKKDSYILFAHNKNKKGSEGFIILEKTP